MAFEDSWDRSGPGSRTLMQKQTFADLLWPRVFPEPAPFPWLDALTTVMSFVAMWLLAHKKVEAWIY